MWAQPLRTAETRVLPDARGRGQPEPKVAVLLNANARKVTPKVIHSLSHAVPEEDLFVSRSELDARRIAQTVVDRRYQVVFTGGGDGTFMGFLNEIAHQIDLRSQHHHHVLPRFGVLKLGTGNSLASLLNSSSTRGDGILDDVLRARANEVPGVRRLDLLEVDGKRAPFAGLGIDGKLLNDYVWVKQNLGTGALRRLLTGGGGYFASVTCRTIPYYLTHSTRVEAEIVNGPRHAAYRLGPDGLPVGAPIAPGAVLYRGELMMAAAGTIPFYGYQLRMFPFAGKRRGMMHLRVGTVSVPHTLANLAGLWAGRWFPEGVHDFHAQDVTIRFAEPMPFQIAGDAGGYRDQLRLSVAHEPIDVLDFNGVVN